MNFINLKKSLSGTCINLVNNGKFELNQEYFEHTRNWKPQKWADGLPIIERQYNKKLVELQLLGGEKLEKYKDYLKTKNHQNIKEIRKIISKYNSEAKIYLGGIPMIADDMITFIKKDMVVFGLGVLIFIIVIKLRISSISEKNFSTIVFSSKFSESPII